MGQYQQWRQYRETDQQLHSRLNQLTSELINLQTQAQELEQNLSLSDNSIIRSLLAQLLTPPPPLTQEPQAESAHRGSTQTELTPPTETDSSLADSNPTLAYEELDPSPEVAFPTEEEPDPSPEVALPTQTAPAETPVLLAHEQLDLSAEDMELLADEQGQTAPIRAIPWWFRNTPAANSSGQDGAFTDQQSLRTNQLVERWLERWGRSDDASQPREEQR